MEAHPNSRLEAFCDGVFAIALTLLIIDVKIPASAVIHDTADFWLALKHTLPSICAFLLSFGIILITWVNHHGTLKLVDKSSPKFVYANGFFLLTVVLFPFPTGLIGEHFLTNHAAPAVILYCAACGLQAVGWNVLTRTMLSHRPLTKNETSRLMMLQTHRYSYLALLVYTLCAIAAVWFPQTVAVVISLIWIYWLFYGINVKAPEH